MNGVGESLEFLQTLRYGLLRNDLFLELRGIREYEDQLSRRRGQIGVWLEYASKIRRDIEICRDGLHHEVAYVVEKTELNKGLGEWRGEEFRDGRHGVDEATLELMYKQDYCLIILRRALSSTSRRVSSIWVEYLSFLEEYERFLETRLGGGLLGMDLGEEYEASLRSCNDLDLWLNYNAYLRGSRVELTKSRHVLDRSLRSLPIEKHHRVWERYLEYITEMGIPELSISVLRRFLLFSYVGGVRMYVQALIDGGRYAECLDMLLGVVLEREGRIRVQETLEGLKNGVLVGEVTTYKVRNKDELIGLVLEIMSEYAYRIDPDRILECTTSLMLERLRTCDSRVYREVGGEANGVFLLTFGEVVCRVAQIFMKLADWEQARSTFSFGVENCRFIHDFTAVYDSLMMFSTLYLSRVLGSASSGLEQSASYTQEDFERGFSSLEKVLRDHKRLLFRTLIKSDTNNVSRWIEYINVLIQETGEGISHPSLEVVKVFEEAMGSIDFSLVKDKSRGILWVFYACYMTSSIDNGHEMLDFGSVDRRRSDQLIGLARDIFERSLLEDVIEDYSLIWTEWIEMELRFGNVEEALNLSRRSICMAKEQKGSKTLRNIRVWQLALDLEMLFGTLQSSRALVEDLFESGMATASLLVSFGTYLRERGCFEESFSLYERSMSCLSIQYSFGLCLDYIDSFISHYNNGLSITKLFDESNSDSTEYGNAKVDRLRDVFDQCLESLSIWRRGRASLKESEHKYYLDCVFIAFGVYSAYEAKIGRVSRAFDILGKAMDELEDHDQHKLNLYSRWIRLTLKCRDISYTRQVFDRAIDDIKASDLLIRLALRYVNFELNMGEVNRVRSIFMFSGDLVPNIYLVNEHVEVFNKFWNTWNQFELEYGNEDTIKDMLRAKKNVALVSGHSSIYSTQTGYKSRVGETCPREPTEASDRNLDIDVFSDSGSDGDGDEGSYGDGDEESDGDGDEESDGDGDEESDGDGDEENDGDGDEENTGDRD